MSSTGIEPITGAAPFSIPTSTRARRPHRRRWSVVAFVAVIAAAAVGVGITEPFRSNTSRTETADNTYPTSTATVTEQTLTSQTQVGATLGYSGSYSVVNQAQGTITSLPAVGQVISQGQVLYEVNGAPVVLLFGSTPAYRSLSQGTAASEVTGPDVQELKADLVTLGYATTSELDTTSGVFGAGTTTALEKFQAHLGIAQTGTLALGQAVFLPGSARITALGQSATLGAPAQPGLSVLAATSSARAVTVALDSSQQTEVAVGDQVTITLPNNQTTPGTVSSVGTIASTASGSSTPTVTVLVTPNDPAATGSWDQAPVEVTITTGSVNHALVVPVDALVALASGGYALEVISAKGVHSLEPVTLGLFDDADGLVQVTGTDVSAGQRIVVPNS